MKPELKEISQKELAVLAISGVNRFYTAMSSPDNSSAKYLGMMALLNARDS
jgi:hypothetical protein